MRRYNIVLGCLGMLLSPWVSSAQEENLPGPWSVLLRASISGSSYESQPAGYKLYSGLALDVSVIRSLSDMVSVELSFRPESREAVGPDGAGSDVPLGSLEMIPVYALVQWHPLGGKDQRVQPYVGVGVDATVTWEKTGALDSSHVPASFGLTAQGGGTLAVASNLVLCVDARWNTMTTELGDYLITIQSTPATPSISVDPLTIGIGVGVRF
jgi:outer membrane protein W